MLFENILPELRNGKNFRRKKDFTRNGFYFLKLEENVFNWYHYSRSDEDSIIVKYGLSSGEILSEDWEMLKD